MGRFLAVDRPDRSGEYDKEAALFHLERAVDCGVLPAIVTAADLYLGRSRDLLTDIQVRGQGWSVVKVDGDMCSDGLGCYQLWLREVRRISRLTMKL